ncbi:hypothetical protein VNO77_46293 [Canavalia gladiata]|uniref:Uncharacterized protein n=1 Tax=Canavalia gladiata TaxID=3824 RepID=A0AAN9PH77_CANGL
MKERDDSFSIRDVRRCKINGCRSCYNCFSGSCCRYWKRIQFINSFRGKKSIIGKTVIRICNPGLCSNRGYCLVRINDGLFDSIFRMPKPGGRFIQGIPGLPDLLTFLQFLEWNPGSKDIMFCQAGFKS